MRIGGVRALGLLAVAPFLLGAGLPVYTIPETLFADPAVKLHQVFTAKPGDILMTAPIMNTEQAFVDEPVKVSIDKFSDEVGPGDSLTPVIAPSRTASVVGGEGHYYCGRDQRGRNAVMGALFGGIGQKFDAIVRFCFIDTDNDQKLDKVFLAGAKDKLLQAPVAITPVSFHTTHFKQLDEGDVVKLRYRKFVPEKMKVELELEVYHKGKKEPFDYIMWSDRSGAFSRQLPRMITNPAKIPYPVYFNKVMGAVVKVANVQPDGTVDFSIERNFGPVMFRPVVIRVQYIYVYI